MSGTPPKSIAISSNELNLLESLTRSPAPLGSRCEEVGLIVVLSGPLDDAGPGLICFVWLLLVFVVFVDFVDDVVGVVEFLGGLLLFEQKSLQFVCIL